ncbi:MAG: hypothetical protein ACHBN1_03335 [Heteroscytonema crispum UTEX LB 1556]
MPATSVKILKGRLTFILLWTTATFGGFLLSLFWMEIGEKSDIQAIQAAIASLAIAAPQSLILRQTIFFMWWVLTTVVGWFFITAIGVGAVGWIVFSTQFLALRVLYGALYGAIGGFGIGLAQCLAIRQTVPSGKRWILVSSLSWAIALPIGSVVGMFLHQSTSLFLGEVVGLGITWLVVAILTGVNAYKILR